MKQIRHHPNTHQPFLRLLLLFAITLPQQSSAIPNPFPLLSFTSDNNNSQQTRRNLSLTQPQTTTTKEAHYSSVVGGDATSQQKRSPSTDDEDDEYTDDGAASEDDNRPERCFATSDCTLCEYGKVEGVCKATGRRQKFDCSTGGDTWRTVYRGCLRTVQDEEWLMLRLQMICIVVAMISLMSTKRQKRVSASLFDQRRGKALMRMGNAASRRGAGGGGSAGDGGTGEDEMVPLNPSLGESETV